MRTRFLITCGDINGIGPEIGVKLLSEAAKKSIQTVFICPENVFTEAVKLTGIRLKYEKVTTINELEKTSSSVILFNIGKFRLSPGKPNKTSGKAAYKSLETAMDIINSGLSNALVTMPISKAAMGLAGFKHPGHTEYLAAKSGSKKFTMMFLSKKLKCALTTIHEPVKKVPKLITRMSVTNQIDIVSESLKKDFGIGEPSIAVLGLNPHAGENGKIGREEQDEIIPAIKDAGNSVKGPFVPDAFFGMKLYKNYDCVIGMYHDQVLIPFKMLDFSKGVNYTAGLNFVRTSPDHGTAVDIAWKNKADASSSIEAFKYAKQIITNRKMH